MLWELAPAFVARRVMIERREVPAWDALMLLFAISPIARAESSIEYPYIFEDWGFTIGDSQYLKEELEKQAKDKYFNGYYKLQYADENGQRITIEISLQDKEKNVKIIKTGWMVRPLGLITCSTPFSGVVK